MAVDPFTGARLQYTYFDFNGDGELTEEDKVEDADGNKIDGSGFSVGDALSQPVFVDNQFVAQSSSNQTTIIEVNGVVSSAGEAKRVSWREVR